MPSATMDMDIDEARADGERGRIDDLGFGGVQAVPDGDDTAITAEDIGT